MSPSVIIFSGFTWKLVKEYEDRQRTFEKFEVAIRKTTAKTLLEMIRRVEKNSRYRLQAVIANSGHNLDTIISKPIK